MFEKCHGRQFVIVPIGKNEPENGVSGRKKKNPPPKKQKPHPPSSNFSKKMLQHDPLARELKQNSDRDGLCHTSLFHLK